MKIYPFSRKNFFDQGYKILKNIKLNVFARVPVGREN